MKNEKELSQEEAEDIFAARLARILVDQILEDEKEKNNRQQEDSVK